LTLFRGCGWCLCDAVGTRSWTAFSLFRAAHFLRLTQREPRPDSAGGISRHITALWIQRVLNPPGGAAAPGKFLSRKAAAVRARHLNVELLL
jgi:hypothetical protein